MRRVERSVAKRWIEAKHYKRALGVFWEAFALIDERSFIQGVVCYGQPSPPIQKHSFSNRDFRLYELTRLVIQTRRENGASMLISRSLKLLREQPCAVISYADSSMGHSGIVYQATNWLYTGAVKAHDSLYEINGEILHPMTVRDKFGVSNPKQWAKANGHKIIKPKPKHRYFYFLGSKKQKSEMRKKLRYPSITPYPKSEKTTYDAGRDLIEVFNAQEGL